jgi:hypothetical protein
VDDIINTTDKIVFKKYYIYSLILLSWIVHTLHCRRVS